MTKNRYLLDSQMSVYRGVSCSPGQILVLFVRDVFAILLNVPLGQSEVDDVQLVSSL
jgi:hypothetical protein